MAAITVSREATKAELAAEMDRRGAVVEALETEIARLQQAIAMANTGGLSLIYEVRAALGWNDKFSLSLLPGGVRNLRKTITEIRQCIAGMVVEGKTTDLTILLSSMLREIDRILAVNRVDGIAK